MKCKAEIGDVESEIPNKRASERKKDARRRRKDDSTIFLLATPNTTMKVNVYVRMRL